MEKNIILQGLEGGQGIGWKHFLNFFPLKIQLRVISAEDLVSFVSNLRPPLFPACNLLFPTWFLLSCDNPKLQGTIGFNAKKLRCQLEEWTSNVCSWKQEVTGWKIGGHRLETGGLRLETKEVAVWKQKRPNPRRK